MMMNWKFSSIQYIRYLLGYTHWNKETQPLKFLLRFFVFRKLSNSYYDVLQEFTSLLIRNRSLRSGKKFIPDVNENWITKTDGG